MSLVHIDNLESSKLVILTVSSSAINSTRIVILDDLSRFIVRVSRLVEILNSFVCSVADYLQIACAIYTVVGELLDPDIIYNLARSLRYVDGNGLY